MMYYVVTGAAGFIGSKLVEGLNRRGITEIIAVDQLVRARLPEASAPIVGLRYFNVYGPNEAHKGRMASVALHAYEQLHNEGRVKLFVGSDGYADGEQRRDFIHVDDVVAVNLWFLERRGVSGIYNCGTGRAQSFNELALAVVYVLHGTRAGLIVVWAIGLVEYYMLS